jgi:hemerythrin-like domain-containing protein
MNITDAICSLKADHRDFLLLFRDLENAVATADQPNLQRTWAEFERRLAGHIDAEEKYLLPCLRRAHPDEVRHILNDHVRFRGLLLELGVRCDLHMLRQTEATELLSLLGSHAALEDETVYKWAEAELDEHHRESLFASLRPIST